MALGIFLLLHPGNAASLLWSEPQPLSQAQHSHTVFLERCWHKSLPEISNALPVTRVEKTNICEYLMDKPPREPSTPASLHAKGTEHRI